MKSFLELKKTKKVCSKVKHHGADPNLLTITTNFLAFSVIFFPIFFPPGSRRENKCGIHADTDLQPCSKVSSTYQKYRVRIIERCGSGTVHCLYRKMTPKIVKIIIFLFKPKSPLIRLINQLMVMGIFCDTDINLIMSYLEPHKFHFKG